MLCVIFALLAATAGLTEAGCGHLGYCRWTTCPELHCEVKDQYTPPCVCCPACGLSKGEICSANQQCGGGLACAQKIEGSVGVWWTTPVSEGVCVDATKLEDLLDDAQGGVGEHYTLPVEEEKEPELAIDPTHTPESSDHNSELTDYEKRKLMESIMERLISDD